jgi:hypothetical protein
MFKRYEKRENNNGIEKVVHHFLLERTAHLLSQTGTKGPHHNRYMEIFRQSLPKKTDLIMDLRRWRIAGDRLQIALLTKAKAEAFEWASFTGSHGKET